MTIEQKDATVDQWKTYPWPEFIAYMRHARDERITMPTATDEDKHAAELEYGREIDRLISKGQSGTNA